jgi:hypothetical protein
VDLELLRRLALVGDIVRWIGEDHAGRLASQKCFHRFLVGGVATQQAMINSSGSKPVRSNASSAAAANAFSSSRSKSGSQAAFSASWCNSEGALLAFGKVGEHDDRHLRELQFPGGQYASVPGDDTASRIDEARGY